MRNRLANIYLFNLLAINLLALMPATLLATPITYQLTTRNTRVTFYVPVFGVFSIRGNIPATGTLVIDNQNINYASANITLYTQKISTGHSHIDLILKGPYFFDVAHYPIASFYSNQLFLNENGQGYFRGQLAIKNYVQPIKLGIALSPPPIARGKPAKTVHINARTQINRNQFGMTGYRPAVSNTVTITINANAIAR
jgi:polyisoprenoid-binding protein YceI